MSDHLSEGCSFATGARLCQVHLDTVERIVRVSGEHARSWHEVSAKQLEMTALQADERYGFVGDKSQPCWEAITLDPRSKFQVSLALGVRNALLIGTLLQDSAARLAHPQNLVLLTDGHCDYATLFPQVFGQSVVPPHTGKPGRPQMPYFRIPHTLAHVQVIKHRQGHKLQTVEVRKAHGRQVRIDLELERLNYSIANTSAVERHNGTMRQMTPMMHRKGLSFAHLRRTRRDSAWLSMLSYNGCRPHRSLRKRLDAPEGAKQYQQRTPAMAIGITSRVWSLAQLLSIPT